LNPNLVENQFPGSCTISVILPTENGAIQKYQSAERVKALIPQEISSQIITVRYNVVDDDLETDLTLSDNRVSNHKKSEVRQTGPTKSYESIIHAKVEGKFASAIIKGVELSKGQFILAIDADVDYPETVISELIKI
jgi:hypothetical protein